MNSRNCRCLSVACGFFGTYITIRSSGNSSAKKQQLLSSVKGKSCRSILSKKNVSFNFHSDLEVKQYKQRWWSWIQISGGFCSKQARPPKDHGAWSLFLTDSQCFHTEVGVNDVLKPFPSISAFLPWCVSWHHTADWFQYFFLLKAGNGHNLVFESICWRIGVEGMKAGRRGSQREGDRLGSLSRSLGWKRLHPETSVSSVIGMAGI